MPSPLSNYLPASFDASEPVAVIAGKAVYPVLTIGAMRSAGVPVRLIAMEGETREDLFESFPEKERAMIKVGQIGHMLRAMQRFRAGYAMMVGQVTPRRLFKGMHPDMKAIALLARLKERNAETIFGAISEEIEKIGVQMLDARAFLDSQLADPGLMTGRSVRDEEASIAHGIRIAKEVARLDIGQGVVVRKGTVISVEAFEGTDEMLRRANIHKTDRLIFVKTVKPNQDYRFDVPCFGLQTLKAMQEGGVSVACLEAGAVIILEKEKVLAEARECGITLYGYTAD